MSEQTDKCRTCNGAGRVIFIHGDRYNRSYREMQICPTCNGGSLFVGSLSLLAEGPTLINPPLLDYIQWSESERERKRTTTAE